MTDDEPCDDGTDRTAFHKDSGSIVSFISRLECEMDGCDGEPEWEVGGHLHFAVGGKRYSTGRSKGELVVCDHHRELIESIVPDHRLEDVDTE